MKQIEEGRASAELIDDVEVLIVLADSNKGDELRMMPDLHWCHDLSSELLGRSLGVHVVFYFFDGDLSASPFSLEDLWRVTVADFLLKDEGCEIYEILLCVSADLLDNEFFEIDEAGFFAWWWLVLFFEHWRFCLGWFVIEVERDQVLLLFVLWWRVELLWFWVIYRSLMGIIANID